MKHIITYVFTAFILASCAAKHNVPLNQNPNKVSKPNQGFSFVDQNGNFYPQDWESKYGRPPKNTKRTSYSLMKNATEKNDVENLKEAEKKYLNQLQDLLKNKSRLFILIHGFNTSENRANESYSLIQKKLKLDTSKDAVIQFYWDGLIAENLLGGVKIWFDATNYSQMAGEFGLRRILNAVKNKDIFLISHSRGASVVLTSLTTVELADSVIEETKEVHNVDVYEDSKNLLENKNKIYAIMLAPAIGITDFQITNPNTKEITYRYFSPQLKVMHITNNESDKMLGKIVGFLSKSLKPTDLGYKSDTFVELQKQYKIIKMTDFTGMKSHKFNNYILNDKFTEILQSYGLK